MIYYNKNKILSFNKDFNFICGGKDIGKSFSIKCHLIHNFLKYGKQFLLLTRYDNEMIGELNKVKTYFNDKQLQKKYKDYFITFKNKTYFITNRNTSKKSIIGYAGALNKLSQQTGSLSLEDIGYILYEEFQNIDGRYLKDEVDKFLILYNTIARGANNPTRKVKVFFLSNAFSIANPFFTQFEIDKKLRIGTKTLNLKNNIAFENAEAQEVTEHIKKSDFYKLIKGSNFEKFAIANKYYLDNEAIIKKINNKDRAVLKFYCDNKVYTLLKNKTYLLFTDKQIKEKAETITITEKDFKPNKIKIEHFKTTATYKIILKFFNTSKIYFTSQAAYRTFLFIISL